MIRIFPDDSPEDVIDKISSALADHGLEIVYAATDSDDDLIVCEVVATDDEADDE